MGSTLAKVGGAAAMLGAVIALVFNLLYPRYEPGDMDAIVGLAADGGRWTLVHFMLAWAIGLVLLGLVVLARSFAAEPARSWARAGLAFAIGGAALLFASIIMLGFSARFAAVEDPAAAAAVVHVGGGLFLGSMGSFFGFAPLLYGVAVLTDRAYPVWLGWLAVLGGAVGVLTGTVVFLTGFTTLTDMVLFPIASVAFTVWVGLMGLQVWQRAGAAVRVGASG